MTKDFETIRDDHFLAKRNKRTKLVADEILYQMKERSKMENDKGRFEGAQKQIRQKICKAKEKWIKILFYEIEALERKHDCFNMHK